MTQGEEGGSGRVEGSEAVLGVREVDGSLQVRKDEPLKYLDGRVEEGDEVVGGAR